MKTPLKGMKNHELGGSPTDFPLHFSQKQQTT
jgi:hypothetical protein